ncbi:MAG: hypothetical protein ABFC63_07890 [Thermoguttaceae bacterium]
MFLRTLLQNWLHGIAKAKVREAMVGAAAERLARPTQPPVEGIKPCHVGLVFALGVESGCFEDLLQGVVTIRSARFRLREGGIAGRRIAIVLSGAGCENARLATQTLIDGHRPGLVISAGFAGGLSPQMGRNDILLADRLLDGQSIDLAVASSALATGPGVHRGPLLTLDHVVGSPAERRSWWQRHAALAVDMETLGVAQVCAERQTAFVSVRVINDLATETLPREVEHLLRQRTAAARLGAALGAVCRRPGAAKAFYELHENALVASSRLARYLAQQIPVLAGREAAPPAMVGARHVLG